MAGYEIQVKSSSGEMLSLPIIAQYDGDGNDIALTYATKAELEKAGLIAMRKAARSSRISWEQMRWAVTILSVCSMEPEYP